MLQEEDLDEPCERFLEDSPADNVENEIKTEAEEENAGTNEEKTEDSSSAVHIKKVTFFLQETVSTRVGDTDPSEPYVFQPL